ncbi:hypothetical protein Avbf_10023 [Armadillidium vulgare]|nr:hypothetical protein Avbf_10023 [Armadillidium vulgare]
MVTPLPSSYIRKNPNTVEIVMDNYTIQVNNATDSLGGFHPFQWIQCIQMRKFSLQLDISKRYHYLLRVLSRSVEFQVMESKSERIKA